MIQNYKTLFIHYNVKTMNEYNSNLESSKSSYIEDCNFSIFQKNALLMPLVHMIVSKMMDGRPTAHGLVENEKGCCIQLLFYLFFLCCGLLSAPLLIPTQMLCLRWLPASVCLFMPRDSSSLLTFPLYPDKETQYKQAATQTGLS